jgi:hypothetical protein
MIVEVPYDSDKRRNDPEPKDPTAISAAGVPLASGLFLAVRKGGIGGRSIAIL